MDSRITSSDTKSSSRRSIRNKRYSRRAYAEDKRPPKRLFTPEIKRFLKEWLVRRRENPYPNREEKKALALQTGLTYIQVCNWFANWRRKLKNAGKEPQRKTWGDLIKTYNTQAQGNVEHFSICSDDSIWEECGDFNHKNENSEESTSATGTGVGGGILDESYFTVAPNVIDQDSSHNNNNNNNKYKNHIMEKYLRDCETNEKFHPHKVEMEEKPSIISKWLESAVNFKPSQNNYLNWTFKNQKRIRSKEKKPMTRPLSYTDCSLHGREELDAAETLTRLANSRSFAL